MNSSQVKREANRVVQEVVIAGYVKEMFDDIQNISKRIFNLPVQGNYAQYTPDESIKLRDAITKKVVKLLKKVRSHEEIALLLHVLDLLYPTSIKVDNILQKGGCNSKKVKLTRAYMPKLEFYYDDFEKALADIAVLDEK